MVNYRHESHLRSLLKGISWRIIATTDTVLVALMITCLFGKCSIENALKIGAVEFLLKLLVYYFHERIWQRYRTGGSVTKLNTIYKSISWRLVATTMTFLISGAILESFDEIALFIALSELFTKFVLYYFHERLWLRLPLGRIRNYFVKRFKK
ncbi:MAG: DUF2061 domain-containing protein [Bacteroidia bacterium]|nr:DUF2061 domain-containing protein [Bacteroidia bacterium]NNF30509.1 DUF2061 domain-containing protein [Flavobacteriaceae bacterium]MBT8276513.1 DUF2061 domain-containing protein [Bacteroidia bacterium]NNJ82228.1 DUF2061 domain-containing protein [Flavobacteriaceae bacterium]NNK53843.1 DUF2061 domain-containing protein [Flavobacteriaceae bacterium]